MMQTRLRQARGKINVRQMPGSCYAEVRLRQGGDKDEIWRKGRKGRGKAVRAKARLC